MLALFNPAQGDYPAAEVACLKVLQGALGPALRVHLQRHDLLRQLLEDLATLLPAVSWSLP